MPDNNDHKPAHYLPPPKPMDLKGNLSENWKSFEEAWDNWIIATKVNKEDETVVKATLLSVLGKETVEIQKNLPIQDRTYKNIIAALKTHFNPQKNITYERYVFNTCNQGDELTDMYVNKLRKLASTCDFGDLKDSLIRDRIVVGIRDTNVRRRLLREKELTLQSCIDICRASEKASERMRAIDGNEEVETVHALRNKHSKKQGHKHKDKQKSKPQAQGGATARPSDTTKKLCTRCGGEHGKKCPAWGKTCGKCHKKNHYACMCQSTRSVHQLDTESESENYNTDESVFQVNSGTTRYMVRPEVKAPNKHWKNITFQMDNGASINCMLYKDYCKIKQDSNPEMETSNKRLTSYSGDRVKNLGQATLQVRLNDRIVKTPFQIVEEGQCSLLSGPVCEQLGLMTISHEHLINIVNGELTEDEVVTKYKDVFEGLGDIGEYHIQIDPKVTPVQDAPISCPVVYKKDSKNKLKQMEKDDMIQNVTEPTDWISSMVVIKKPNKLRVCLDPKNLNKAIKVPKFHMPTIEDVTCGLGKVKVFTVCDANDGFLQVRLDKESQLLTTFHTPFGRYMWKRLPFGLNAAPEEFQRRTREIIEGLKGVETVADDTVVWGEGDTLEEAVIDHDNNFVAFLERCRERNYKLNKSKLRFKQTSVAYHGHVPHKRWTLP